MGLFYEERGGKLPVKYWPRKQAQRFASMQSSAGNLPY